MVQEATDLYDRAMERAGLLDDQAVSDLAQEARLAAKNAMESLDRMNFGLTEEEQVSGLMRILAGLNRAIAALESAVSGIRARSEDDPSQHPEGPPPADGQPVVPPPAREDDPEGGEPTVPSGAPYGDEDAANGDD